MARTAGNWVAVVGTRSSSRSPRRPSCARVPLESTIRRVLLRSRRARPSSRGRSLHGLPACFRQDAAQPPRQWPEGRPCPGPHRVKRVLEGCSADGGGAVAGTSRLLLAAREMSTSPSSLPPPPTDLGDEGSAVLIRALETAPTAIYCLSSEAADPVWANARARARGTVLPVVGGRSVADLVNRVLRTGAPETVSGPIGTDGPMATVVVRPLQVAGKPGALLVLEGDGSDGDNSPWPTPADDVVEQAQLSLLPPSLPLLPDLHLSGSYHRATLADAAGGDWYDAVPLGDGRLALVVGDAVGHGVPAVGAMGRLRGAMRSSALLDPAPDVVLAALDAFAGQMDDVEGASVFYGVLDAATGRLVYTAAGHPPPLVIHSDGSVTSLPLTPRPPLASVPGTPAPIAEHVLEQGATLILFSNGAVAGDASDPDEGRHRLAEVARTVLSTPGALELDGSAGLAGSIAEGVRRPQGWPDDVAVLVAHRRATTLEPLRLDLQAVPAALPGVRRRLGRWLEGLGMGEQDRV